MFHVDSYKGTREENYQIVIKQLQALLEGETDRIANLANASALLNSFLENVNWVGFYLLQEDELVLGPFQGLPACVRIKVGRGVCGTAVQELKTMRIEDVHQFPGHIACDAASRSEIVIPIHKDGVTIGVLDIDSPDTARFDEVDQNYLEQFTDTLRNYL
ncbi:GAF domain-containing protein [Pseudalkalibacillus decolorationis]|uniref:GAF domain-containing protein n=1 Tax=Pseudalkalibacillus decolorationis TaxID=163879 RepID=UPI002149916B|nr:GAF domain-containing protein [Pseudalkalibacillus decolorationis]